MRASKWNGWQRDLLAYLYNSILTVFGMMLEYLDISDFANLHHVTAQRCSDWVLRYLTQYSFYREGSAAVYQCVTSVKAVRQATRSTTVGRQMAPSRRCKLAECFPIFILFLMVVDRWNVLHHRRVLVVTCGSVPFLAAVTSCLGCVHVLSLSTCHISCVISLSMSCH